MNLGYMKQFNKKLNWHHDMLQEIYLLIEISFFYSLLAPLKCFGVLVLERLQICHGPHALTFQTLIVMTRFGIWP